MEGGVKNEKKRDMKSHAREYEYEAGLLLIGKLVHLLIDIASVAG